MSVRATVILTAALGIALSSPAVAQEQLPGPERYTVRVEYRELRPTLTGQAQKGVNDQAGTLIDLVDDLGVAKKRTFEVRGAIKIGTGTKLRAGWIPLDYDGDIFANRTFRFGGTRFFRLSQVITSIKGNYFSASYQWDFMRRRHGFLGVTAGGRLVDVDYLIVSPNQGDREEATLRRPFPVGGLVGRYYAGRISLDGELSMLPAGDRATFYEGELAGRLHLSDRLAAGAGYRFLSLRGKEDPDQLRIHFAGWQFGLELSL